MALVRLPGVVLNLIMIRMNAMSRFDQRKVQRRAAQGSIRSLRHAGAYLRLTARRSIRRSATESKPGTPPHTRRGRLRESIRFSVEKNRQRVIIGPAYSKIHRIGSRHEFGGTEHPKWNPNWNLRPGGHGPLAFDSHTVTGSVGKLRTPAQVTRARRIAREWQRTWKSKRAGGLATYPPRPFMGPALRKTEPRLPRMWAGAIRP